MISILALGKGHRVWWSLYLGRFALAIGRHGALKEWSETMIGDRVNGRGLLEVSSTRVVGWACFAWWTGSHPETT